MTFKEMLIYIVKLLLCGFAFALGTIVGGGFVSFAKLPPPPAPAGADMSMMGLYLLLASPLVAFGLAVLARGLAGGFITRTLILAFLTWIAYMVNTQLEAALFSTYAAGFWFAVTSSLFSSLLCGAAVAYLFPTNAQESFVATWKSFFHQRRAASWVWRLMVATVAFAPIYFFFGLLVTPFTLEYYQQNMFGLAMPTIEQILPILFFRSLLFLLACLPVIIAWQKPARSLFFRLGTALYILVGFVYMLISTWLPLSVRFPHALEILADEFVYAGVLVLLLARRDVSASRTPRVVEQKAIA